MRSRAIKYAREMESLFENGKNSDCRIIAKDGKEFNLHMEILAVASPVFRTMFKDYINLVNLNDIDEPEEWFTLNPYLSNATHRSRKIDEAGKIFQIDDFNSPELEEMFRFIYTKKVRKMPWKLLVAATKFEIKDLKNLCESKLIKSIGNENACELAIWANRHSVNVLKSYTIEYIQMHSRDVMGKTNGWKILTNGNHQELLHEIMEAIESADIFNNANVCELLILADKHSAILRKTNAIKYIKMNVKEVMASNGWKLLREADYNKKLIPKIIATITKKILPNSIGNENACELLILANHYSAENLKIEAINYVQLHLKEVIKSEGWKMLIKGKHVELMEQIMKTMVEAK